jgi:IS1 family transposase
MVTGNRNIETMQRLYAQLKKFKNAVFATDDWDAFAAVLPKDRHKIGKRHTHAMERYSRFILIRYLFLNQNLSEFIHFFLNTKYIFS